jgi:hypothetical protein
MADPARYLLPTERPVINIRRHWAVLAGNTLQSLLLLLLGIFLYRVFDSLPFVRTVAIYFCVFVVARWLWVLGDWYVEKLIVTDKRILLLTGIVTRKVAIMPLVKVTDLTYNRSTIGLMLGYGQFVAETAGQDQALSTIDYVPRPEQLYMQISELLFGGDKGAPGALVTSAQRQAEEEAERLARRRWRRFSRWRRSETDEAPGRPAERSARTAALDDILADRDTLLADRDDPDWRRDEPPYSYDQAEPAAGRGPDPIREGPAERDRLRARGPTDPTDPTDPTVELPGIHQPRRSADTGSTRPAFRPELPPPPRSGDEPAGGSDPADD